MNKLTESMTSSPALVGLIHAQIPPDHVKRDALISMLLQDRNILRVISAPHGFGKTELAREYAIRLFSNGSVVWVHCSDPSFLLSLDAEDSLAVLGGAAHADLVIFDNLPWLHEQRAQVLSHCIDMALYAGTEVIVTTLPSCDCLSALQADRLLVCAQDLLAKEQECIPRHDGSTDADGRAFGIKRWRNAGGSLFGRVPAVIWGTSKNACCECLAGFFEEKLPLDLLRSMLAMLLLGQGSLEDLRHARASLRMEDIGLLTRNYPIFGIDLASGCFEVAQFDLGDLRNALIANNLESMLVDGEAPLSERVLEILFKRGNSKRGPEIVETFCTDEQCVEWLLEHGWNFLDAGKLALVTTLLGRCPEASYAQDQTLQAIHAWLSGLSGDRREACHIAENILARHKAADGPNAAVLAARLALAMFDENAIIAHIPDKYASPEGPLDEVDFLAQVMDVCSDEELARAFRAEGAAPDCRYEQMRKAPSKRRARQIAYMVTEHADRFLGTRAFCIALHLLAHIDSVLVRRTAQELGCNLIVDMRRNGVVSFSEAVFVRDMWQLGYFGLVGPVMDRRDATVLDASKYMLTMLAHCCGNEAQVMPWELSRSPLATLGADAMPKNVVDGVDGMSVRLFGGFEVAVGDRYFGESKWRKKTRALFALLVLNQGRDVPREEILNQLWPSLERVHALDNFYTIWSNCTSIIGELPYLERNGEFCRIDPRFVHSDIAEFEQLTRHLLNSGGEPTYLLDTYAKIESLYRGSLMPSETGVMMVNAQRERYRSLYVDAMVAATTCALEVGDVRIALWFARKAMEEDQEREDVYQSLIKAQIASGQRCPAIKTYLKCRDYLRTMYGLDPSVETRELYNSLVTVDPELLRLDAMPLDGAELFSGF